MNIIKIINQKGKKNGRPMCERNQPRNKRTTIKGSNKRKTKSKKIILNEILSKNRLSIPSKELIPSKGIIAKEGTKEE